MSIQMSTFNSKIEEQSKPREEGLKEIEASLERAGLKEKLDENIYAILALLEKGSKFNEDSRSIAIGTENVLNFLEKKYADRLKQFAFTPDQKKAGRIAAILHDIGKAGPAEATEEQRKAVIKIFALENIKEPDSSVEETVAAEFGAEAEKIISRLEECGVNSQMTMRQFWDRHAVWTHDILEKYPSNLSKDVRIIAGSHHYDRGINPYNLPEGKVPIQSATIGLVEEYADASRWILTVIDKYQAMRTRSGVSHEQAIAWVRNNLNEFIEKDESMKLICDAIDELGKKEAIFKENERG